jgi:RsmE family RNA methyltransferase
MPNYFCYPLPNENRSIFILPREKQKHFRANRLTDGDSFNLVNGKGKIRKCILIDKKKYKCKLLSTHNFKKNRIKIRAIIPILENKRIAFMITKLTELGIDAVYFYKSKFTQPWKFRRKRIRNHSISSLEQCERLWLPNIFPLVDEPFSLEMLIKMLINKRGNENSCIFLALPNGPGLFQILNSEVTRLKHWTNLYFIVGPEGGFHSEEQQLVQKITKYKNFKNYSISDNILRTETSAFASLAVFKEFFRNMDI